MTNNNLINKYKNIIIDRQGIKPNSNMTTIDIIGQVKPDTYYKVTLDGLISINFNNNSHQLENHFNENKNDNNNKILSLDDIKHIKIKNNWCGRIKIDTIESNILGNSGKLLINAESLNNNNQLVIPIEDINKIGYYDCKLLSINNESNLIKFDTNVDLPVCTMQIGAHYLKNYIMKKAGGVYLEYHDRPHFHMPMNNSSKGYLVLGKMIKNNANSNEDNSDKNNQLIALSAFQIPYGKAIYMNKNVIHNDCFLIGDYIVVYSKTENYSTVLLKNSKNNSVEVIIN